MWKLPPTATNRFPVTKPTATQSQLLTRRATRVINPKLSKLRLASVFGSFCCSLLAAPPGASVSVKLDVPDPLRHGVFSQDRYLNVPPGFHAALFALVPGARFLAVAPNGDVLVSNPGAGTITLLRPDSTGKVPSSSTWVSGLNNPHGIVFHQVA